MNDHCASTTLQWRGVAHDEHTTGRHTLRGSRTRQRPFYAVVIVLVFALAIGANSTVFSVLNGLLLRPLPYATATGS